MKAKTYQIKETVKKSIENLGYHYVTYWLVYIPEHLTYQLFYFTISKKRLVFNNIKTMIIVHIQILKKKRQIDNRLVNLKMKVEMERHQEVTNQTKHLEIKCLKD